MAGDEQRPGSERSANDNHAPDEKNAGENADAAERLDAMVLSIARLIGRRIAREDHAKAMRAANDNALPETGDDDR